MTGFQVAIIATMRGGGFIDHLIRSRETNRCEATPSDDREQDSLTTLNEAARSIDVNILPKNVSGSSNDHRERGSNVIDPSERN
jgi:hypothetical protein